MTNSKGIISLEGMEFYAYHGYYEEEQKLGNRYVVDVHMEMNISKAATSDQLEFTADYVEVYQIVSNIFSQKAKLLETLAQQINQEILLSFPAIVSITTEVAKQQPPIAGLCKAAKVSLTSHR